MKVPIYDQTRGQVDEILYGRDLDPKQYTEADIEKLQLGAAGKSSVTKELEVRSESKKIVPHEHGFATNLLFPEDEGLQTVKKSEVAGNVSHDAWQQGERAAGNGSVHNAHLKHREIEYVDGQKGSRKARGSPKDSAGAAGKKIGKESALMQTKASANKAFADETASRPFGKASGLRAHSDSEGVGSVLGAPRASRASAYELALAEGRALLANPYTGMEDGGGGEVATLPVGGGPKPTKSRTGYTPPKYGVGDAAGNFRKERMLVTKSRPEAQFGAPPPFGVDPVHTGATVSRFSTSSSTIGGTKKDRIIDYTSMPPGTGAPAPASTMIVPAGQRPLVPVHPEGRSH